jgi:hypothetical protein
MRKSRVAPDRAIILGKSYFEGMVKKMKSGDDVQTVLIAYYTYLGHRNIVNQ